MSSGEIQGVCGSKATGRYWPRLNYRGVHAARANLPSGQTRRKPRIFTILYARPNSSSLFTIDEDLAETTRQRACPCGGRLHCANYTRKPRGTPIQLPEPQPLRLSFCCDRDGCRKRVTPPSVRFLGRKVYLAAIVKVTEKIGWDTNERFKSLAIDSLSRDLEDGNCIPQSSETYEELRTFVHGERGKMGGLPGKHDDRVMALSLASIAARQEVRRNRPRTTLGEMHELR